MRSILQRLRWLVPVLAGVVWALAFPSSGIAGFGWVAPALVLVTAGWAFPKKPFLGGWLAGLAFSLTALRWLLAVPFPAGAVAGWLALSAFLALYTALWTWLGCRWIRGDAASFFDAMAESSWARRQRWGLGLAALWVAFEMVQSRFLSGFPWNLLGTSQFQMTPLIQVAEWTGVSGVSFLMVWFSFGLASSLVLLVKAPSRRRALAGEILVPALLVTLLFAVGSNLIAKSPAPMAVRRIALIQPSIPQLLIWDRNESTNRFRALVELTRAALTNQPHVVVWPEASLPDISREQFEELRGMMVKAGVPLLFGADDVEPVEGAPAGAMPNFYNTAFHLDAKGDLVGRYRKRKLVAFGEYVPLERWLPFMKWLTPIGGSFSAGTGPELFRVGNPPLAVGPLICFEDVFAPVCREAALDDVEVLVNFTNLGWFGDGAAQWQHAAAAVFRAVENRRPIVRATNNGVTCWIDSTGRIREVLRDRSGGIYGPGFLIAEVDIDPPSVRKATFYRRNGDVFGWSCVVLSVFGVLPMLRGLRRKRAG